jgi:hypothetical protein
MSDETSPKSWSVDVDGVERRITVETDAESGRTQIRVDGRMAARPMAANETERTFAIGSHPYVLRRNDTGELELDFDEPLPAVTPPAYKKNAPVEKPTSHLKGKVIGAIVVLVLIPVVRWTSDAIRYLRVPWKVYDSPDHRFRVSFPTEPEQSTDSIDANGSTLRTMKYQSHYHHHFYVVEFIEFPFIIPREKEGELIEGALDGMVKHEQSTIVQRGWSRVARRDAMHFIMQMPKNRDWSGGTARGFIARSGQRLYILYAYVPRSESTGFDIGEYLRSFDLPDD